MRAEIVDHAPGDIQRIAQERPKETNCAELNREPKLATLATVNADQLTVGIIKVEKPLQIDRVNSPVKRPNRAT